MYRILHTCIQQYALHHKEIISCWLACVQDSLIHRPLYAQGTRLHMDLFRFPLCSDQFREDALIPQRREIAVWDPYESKATGKHISMASDVVSSPHPVRVSVSASPQVWQHFAVPGVCRLHYRGAGTVEGGVSRAQGPASPTQWSLCFYRRGGERRGLLNQSTFVKRRIYRVGMHAHDNIVC